MKRFLLFVGGTFLLASTIITVIYFINTNSVKKELKDIEVQKIRFFMTRDEIEQLYGPGPDETQGCFGCEANFIYPELKISGRYSETLDRKNNYNKSPKVKEITTTNTTLAIFGVHVGDTILKGKSELESKGFKLQDDEKEIYFNYFFKDNVYVRLWIDDQLNHRDKDRYYLGHDDEIINSITVRYRVIDDESIIY